MILPINIYHNGLKYKEYAFLDSGSKISMIETELAEKLNLKGSQSPLKLYWTNGISHEDKTSSKVSITISAFPNGKRYKLQNLRTFNNLDLPKQSLSQEMIHSFKHFKNISIEPYYNIQPTILLGADNVRLLIAKDN